MGGPRSNNAECLNRGHRALIGRARGATLLDDSDSAARTLLVSCSAIGRLDGLLFCEAVGIVNHEDFEMFVRDAEPRLRRALLGAVGSDRVEDAVGEALAYAFEHWNKVKSMVNPVGYLYRVGQSKSRPRKRLRLFRREPETLPNVNPGLVEALEALPLSQRSAVWLAHGCGWSHAEIAESLGVSTSTVATHVSRGLARLRVEMGVTA
jgi:DNA-directed RNA polymerase specialized sigma24 family protein